MSTNPLGKLQQRSVRAPSQAPAQPDSLERPNTTRPIQNTVHGKRRRGSGNSVQQTVRLRHEDWKKLNQVKIEHGWSAQEQFIMGLGLLFAQLGIEKPVSPAQDETK